MSNTKTILFAGGGTGGHIYPNLAIIEALRQIDTDIQPHLIVSNRPIDRQILENEQLPFTTLPMTPFSTRPKGLLQLGIAWPKSRSIVDQLIKQTNAVALVSTGGFVSVPATGAAKKAGIPSILINLDAVPGKANRLAARSATKIYSAFAVHQLNLRWEYEPIAMPLRQNAVGPESATLARKTLQLEPHRKTLLIVGGSQGAASLNQTCFQLLADQQLQAAFRNEWQLLHIVGPDKFNEALQRHESLALPGRVIGFCNQMGHAWRAADLAISRAGAGSVAEAWFNQCPCIFLPYPGHRDQHQKHNAAPMVDAGAAICMTDHNQPDTNAQHLRPILLELLTNQNQRLNQLKKALEQSRPNNSSNTIAQTLTTTTGSSPGSSQA